MSNLIDELVAAGECPPRTKTGETFKGWLKGKAEKELWFFSRWILGNDLLSKGTFHRREVCPFLSSFTRSRSKLLMLPMGHLKTTLASRSLPLHVMIQSGERNLYFSGVVGRNMRVLLANENEQKSKENLSWIAQHMLTNDWLRWLWPDVFWQNKKDATAGGARWTDMMIDVKRSAVWAEPSITTVGLKTGFIGRYYDVIVGDDLAALEASQNPPLMERAKKWRRAARTRLWDKSRGILIGVGTHWPSVEDLYTEWKNDPDVEVMVYSVIKIEHDRETPLWPEQFPLDLIKTIRQGTDPQDWACWYMNRPASRGYSALDWEQLREFRIEYDDLGNQQAVFSENTWDERIAEKHNRTMRNLGFTLGSPWDLNQAKARTRAPNGMDASFYEFMREKYRDPDDGHVIGVPGIHNLPKPEV